jgi:dTDP-glucose pyrophosphorylase/CBS domain-containing protein
MDLQKLIIGPYSNLQDAIKKIDDNGQGAVVVVDEGMRVMDLLTDGDIRREILNNRDLSQPVGELRERRQKGDFPDPIMAPIATPRQKLLEIMKAHSIRLVPLLDEQDRLVDVAFLSELEKQAPLPCRAIIMAGGLGTRLKPLTDEMPKPLLPVGEKPIIELLINRLSHAGFKEVIIATCYLGDQISSYLGNGSEIGIAIQYIEEKSPLGTAGALSLIKPSDLSLLVINGDILTKIDFHAMFRFHEKSQASMTVGLHQITYQIPYGVVQVNGADISAIQEKPEIPYLVSAGVYLISPGAHLQIPKTKDRFDMTDLIGLLLKQGDRVVGFSILEYWLDIGHLDDYRKANKAMQTGEFR